MVQSCAAGGLLIGAFEVALSAMAATLAAAVSCSPLIQNQWLLPPAALPTCGKEAAAAFVSQTPSAPGAFSGSCMPGHHLFQSQPSSTAALRQGHAPCTLQLCGTLRQQRLPPAQWRALACASSDQCRFAAAAAAAASAQLRKRASCSLQQLHERSCADFQQVSAMATSLRLVV
jgi:hypothetical protein